MHRSLPKFRDVGPRAHLPVVCVQVAVRVSQCERVLMHLTCETPTTSTVWMCVEGRDRAGNRKHVSCATSGVALTLVREGAVATFETVLEQVCVVRRCVRMQLAQFGPRLNTCIVHSRLTLCHTQAQFVDQRTRSVCFLRDSALWLSSAVGSF